MVTQQVGEIQPSATRWASTGCAQVLATFRLFRSVGQGAVPVALGVSPLKRSGPAVSARVVAVGGSVVPAAGVAFQRFGGDLAAHRLFGLLCGLVALGGRVIAQRSAVIALIGRPVAEVGRLVASVRGLVAR